MTEVDYVLGHSETEIYRLELRGFYYAPTIMRMLRKAGLEPGMSVLDIGTGAGDAALLAGQIVGSSGSVLGIDPAMSALDRARTRTRAAGYSHVRYEATRLEDMPGTDRFNVVMASHVIGHVADPVAFLRGAAARVHPGGVLIQFEVALPQPDLPEIRTGYRWSAPPVRLYDQVADLCMVAFALGKSRTYDGGRLVRLYHDAGLPEPSLAWEEQVCGPRGPIVESLYLTFKAVLPALRSHGVEAITEIDVENLYERMQAAVHEAHAQVRFDNLVSAWTTLE